MLIAGTILLLFGAAAAIALWSIDANTLASPLRERVKTATGRDLAIGGGTSLALAWEPRIELRDVTLSNAPWASDKTFIAAKRVEVQFAWMPLLARKLDLRKVIVTEPEISLEVNAAGRGNWELTAPSGAGPNSAEPEQRSAVSDEIGIGHVVIDRGTIVYRGGAQRVTRVAVEHFDLRAGDLDAAVNASFTGAVDGMAIVLTGQAGPLRELVTRRAAYPMHVEGEIAGRKLKAQAKLAPDVTTTRFEDVEVVLGGSALRGSIVAPKEGGGPIAVQLQSQRLEMTDLTWPTGPVAVSDPARRQDAPTTQPATARVLSAEPLGIALLPRASVQAELRIAELVLRGGTAWRNVHAQFTTGSGRLDAPDIRADVMGGRLQAALHVDARTEPAQVHLTADGNDLELGALLLAAGASSAVKGGKTRLHLDLTTRGASEHEWARHATGSIHADVGAASLALKSSGKDSPVSELLGVVLPIANAGSATQLHCAVARLAVRDGVAHLDRSAGIETESLGLLASGSVDLGAETLDVTLRPSVPGLGRFDLGQLAGTVHWRGPWRNASLTIDALSSAGAVASVGALLAGHVVGPIAGVLIPRALPQAGACTVARR